MINQEGGRGGGGERGGGGRRGGRRKGGGRGGGGGRGEEGEVFPLLWIFNESFDTFIENVYII